MDDMKIAKHNRIKLLLKIAGLLLMAGGFVLVVIAFVDFFSKIMSDDMEMPTKFWMFFVGFPSLAIGATLTVFGFKRGIITYIKNETVPVISETVSDLSGAFSGAAHAVKQGLAGDIEKCPCGAFNKKDSDFCSQCGANLKTECGRCGYKNETNSRYCNKCGNKL